MKKQETASETVYRGRAIAIAELVGTITLLSELEMKVELPIDLNSDTKAAVQGANAIYFIWKKIQQGLIKANYTATC